MHPPGHDVMALVIGKLFTIDPINIPHTTQHVMGTIAPNVKSWIAGALYVSKISVLQLIITNN